MAKQESFAFATRAESAASGRRARRKAKAPPRTKRPPKEPRGRASALDLAKKQRDISISEFFAKNRHLLGFDNPSKALLTTVKEGVDNSLDACEDGGILPDVRVEISQDSESRFRIAIQDTAPGILR